MPAARITAALPSPGVISVHVRWSLQHPRLCLDHATDGAFKPLVRILKNLRGKLVDDGLLGEGIASSYFLEGLPYNVLNENFFG